MTQGGYHLGKSSGRSKTANHENIPSIPTPVIEQDDTSFIPSSMPIDQTLLLNSTPSDQILRQRSTLVIPETSSISPNQSSPTGQNMNAQSNTAVEATSSQRNVSVLGDSSCTNGWNLLPNAPVPLHCLSKVKLIPKGSTEKVSQKMSKMKNFYWDTFVSEVVVKQQWSKKEKWMELWKSYDCVKKSEINSKNHYGGCEVAVGTHICVSITAGEYRKKLEKYEEIVWKKLQHKSKIDQLETYYEVAGGAKKKRLFSLGSEANSYFGKKLCACKASTSLVSPSVSLPTKNLEFVKQLISTLTTHFLSVVIEHVGGIRVQEGAVLDPPPTNNDDDDVDS
ncbi:hypothetical protein P3L10_020805 [Capsicum annuum]|uniref:uncharacterized protein LOC124885767 n=1 Tax=Capsicum annuum TaxID=4072 RepID=UPI001FB05CAF|nr:uncharacterized protein LOC124885767 [Capsicum annuum]